MRITTRLWAVAAANLVLVGTIFGVTFVVLHSVVASYNQVIHEHVATINGLKSAQIGFLQEVVALEGVVASPRASRTNALQHHLTARTAFAEQLGALQLGHVSESSKAQIARFMGAVSAYYTDADTMLAAAADPRAALGEAGARIRGKELPALDLLNGLTQNLDREVATMAAAANDKAEQAVGYMEALAVLLVFVSIGAVIGQRRGVVLPILDFAAQIGTITTERNLSQRLTVHHGGELDDLAGGLNAFIADIERVLANFLGAADQVAAMAHSLSDTSQGTARAMQQMTDAVQGVMVTAETQAEQAAEGAEGTLAMVAASSCVTTGIAAAQAAAGGARRTADDGRQVLAHGAAKVENLHQVILQLGTTVQRLGMLGDQIGSIVAMITSLASQTNLLALNASIEAARAGEHGRGFAVVAHEVGKLATESAGSARQIAAMITEIQSETRQAGELMRRGEAEVLASVAVIRESGAAFQSLVGAVVETDAHCTDIARTNAGVAEGLQAIHALIQSMSAMTVESATSMRQMAAVADERHQAADQESLSAERLAATSAELLAIIGQFKVNAVRSLPVERAVMPALRRATVTV